MFTFQVMTNNIGTPCVVWVVERLHKRMTALRKLKSEL